MANQKKSLSQGREIRFIKKRDLVYKFIVLIYYYREFSLRIFYVMG